MADHRNYTHNLKLWNESLEKIQAWTGFELVTFALPTELSSQLSAGHFVSILHK